MGDIEFWKDRGRQAADDYRTLDEYLMLTTLPVTLTPDELAAIRFGFEQHKDYLDWKWEFEAEQEWALWRLDNGFEWQPTLLMRLNVWWCNFVDRLVGR